MLFYAKRRIAAMLSDVLPSLVKKDREHLLKRLDRPDEGSAIQALWELSVLWAMQRQFNTDFNIQKREHGQPDCWVDIGLSKPLMIEVYSPTGQTFGFKTLLDPVTKQFRDIVNTVAPDTGGQLRITYHEWAEETRFGRKRVPSVTKNAAQNPEVVKAIERFWRSGQKSERIDVPGSLYATFERTPYSLASLNYSCQIPAQPQSVVNNFSIEASEKAARQLGPFKPDHITGLVVCDGGNELFSNPRRHQAGMSFDREEIFRHAVRQSGIDFLVCVGRVEKMVMGGLVMSPLNRRDELAIEIFFANAVPEHEAIAIANAMNAALLRLPVPRIPLSRSKSLQDQIAAGALPRKNRKRWSMSSNRERMEFKISARAVLDLLNGAMSLEQFRAEHWWRGPCDFPELSITNIALATDIDADDDEIVLTLSKDPSAQPFSEMGKEIMARVSAPE